MKYKTAELEGDALDYMVQCAQRGEQPLCSVAEWKAGSDDGRSPSTYWDHGGPLIERESIRLEPMSWVAGTLTVKSWAAALKRPVDAQIKYADGGQGETPLIAAMRAYVTSVFGEEVEIPWLELMHEEPHAD